MLTDDELGYYGRQIKLSGFGIECQEILKKSRVLIVGVGGLGCPIALYLAAAGVGTIGLVDGDTVSKSNLHRQIIFSYSSVGEKKSEFAARRLNDLNPFSQFVSWPVFGCEKNLIEIAKDYDVIVDGTDNYQAKYLINDVAVILGIPFVYGSISQFEGQVAVFNHRLLDGGMPVTYRDLFPEPPPPGFSQSCTEAGVLGVLPGIIGLMQANEVIKVLTRIGEPLSGKLLSFDALACQSKIHKISKRSFLSPPEACFEKQSNIHKGFEISVLTVGEFLNMKSSIDFQLIDVRSKIEREADSLGGIHIPLLELPDRVSELRPELRTVVYCDSGGRSAKAQIYLSEECEFLEVYSLAGGIAALRDQQKEGRKQ